MATKTYFIMAGWASDLKLGQHNLDTDLFLMINDKVVMKIRESSPYHAHKNALSRGFEIEWFDKSKDSDAYKMAKSDLNL